MDSLQSIYRPSFYIHQITVISVTIQNIWTNENSCWQTLKATATYLLLWGMVLIGNAFCEKCIYNFIKWHGSNKR